MVRQFALLALLFALHVTPTLGQEIDGLWLPLDSTNVKPIYVGDNDSWYRLKSQFGLCALKPMRDSSARANKKGYTYKRIERDTIYFRRKVYYKYHFRGRRDTIISNCMIDD